MAIWGSTQVLNIELTSYDSGTETDTIVTYLHRIAEYTGILA